MAALVHMHGKGIAPVECRFPAGETFKLLHVNELDDMAQASPAIVGERLLLRTEQRLYSIRRKG